MKIFKNVLIFIVGFLIALFLSSMAGDYYRKLFGGGTWVDLGTVVGFPLAYIFFLTLLFTAFGDRHKHWWIGILLIPALWFELYFDLSHLYVPITLGLVGWLLGFGISKLLPKKNLS